jgi:calcineurin-like phosphoesterase family protein
MNNALIDNWNAVVNDEDSVYVLGDFSLESSSTTRNIVQLLKGHKYLVMGNHDRQQPPLWFRSAGFEYVSEYPIVVDCFFILSHEPMFTGLVKNQTTGAFSLTTPLVGLSDSNIMMYGNIHGHTHSFSIADKHYRNVCVEKTDYRPVLLDEVEEEMRSIT